MNDLTRLWEQLAPKDNRKEVVAEILAAYADPALAPKPQTVRGWITDHSVPGRDKNSNTWNRDLPRPAAHLTALGQVARDRLGTTVGRRWIREYIAACEAKMGDTNRADPISHRDQLLRHIVTLTNPQSVPTIGDLAANLAHPRWQFCSTDTGGLLPPYVPRTIGQLDEHFEHIGEDEQITRLLTQATTATPSARTHRFVVVRGEPASGKTRTLLHHLTALPPDNLLLVPRSWSDLDEIDRLIQARATARGGRLAATVLLLDDLQHAITTETRQLGDTLHSLSTITGLVIAVTIHTTALPQGPYIERDQLQAGESVGLDHALRSAMLERCVTLRSTLTIEELEQAPAFQAALSSGRPINEYLNLAVQLRAIPQLTALWERVHTNNNRTDALRRAALDALLDAWFARPHGIETETLREWTLRRIQHTHPQLTTINNSALHDAIDWLDQPDTHGLHSFNTATKPDHHRLHDRIAHNNAPTHQPPNPHHFTHSEQNTIGARWHELNRAELASHWWRHAAEAGNTDATYNIGFLLHAQQRVSDDDPDSAIHWYKQAAHAGDRDAMLQLGFIRYHQERISDDDPDSAIHWNKKAAHAGSSKAMLLLGLIRHKQQRISDDDADSAIHWYKKAAHAGNSDAMLRLGTLRYLQEPVSDDDADSAIHWYKKAAHAGNTDAMLLLGLIRHEQECILDDDADSAIHWYKKAAAAGNTDAMVRLGNLRCKQHRTTDDDPDSAIHWYKKAADLGDDGAMFRLGSLRDLQGRISDNDPDSAIHWYKKAAAAGNADAMFDLGLIRMERGIFWAEEDGGMYWLRAAAAAGNTHADELLRNLRFGPR